VLGLVIGAPTRVGAPITKPSTTVG